ncbi:hypothetical protein [Selenomonas sp. AE3005]|uniref:hypothetical protein n=1 Tax=Selenomonas sp. AE3005 TaxID=1485543 RepID=UPI0012DE5E3E|nr:hypothetical protein [Selenomonas sp. AE3005]
MIQISTKIPWLEIENAYIRGYTDETGAHKYPTVRELAEQYKVNASSVQRHSKQEQWLLKREQFAHRVREKATQKMIEEVSDESCDLNLKLFNIASRIADEIQDKLDEDISPKDLSVLSAALKNCQSVSASTLGDDKASDELTINVSLETEE